MDRSKSDGETDFDAKIDDENNFGFQAPKHLCQRLVDKNMNSTATFKIMKNELYVTPGNFKTISYLNLEIINFNVRGLNFYDYKNHVTDTCLYRRVQEIYALERYQRDSNIRSQITEHLEFQYTNRALSRVQADCIRHMHDVISSDNWAHSARLFEYYCSTKSSIESVFCSQWNAIVNQIKNSEAFVHCFKAVFSSSKGRKMITHHNKFMLHIEYFLAHSHVVEFDGRAFLCELYRMEMGWFQNSSPFQMAFSIRSCEEFRLHLNYMIKRNIPLILLWILPEAPSDDNELWPLLGVYGAPQGYFYTREFKMRLILELLRAIYQKSSMDDTCNSIRTLWRALPTPLPTVEELTAVFQLDILSRLGNNAIFQSPLETFMRAYPADCISEMNQPRSLKHLARCAFRQTLYTPLEAPSDSLPSCIRHFVHLQE